MKSTNKKEKVKYCTECGHLMAKHFIQKFDENTGKQETDWHCTNLKCEEGCGFVGHQFGFLSDKCKRCGYVCFQGY